MILVDHMIKACEAHRASQKIWSCTNQVHILVNSFTLLFVTCIKIWERQLDQNGLQNCVFMFTKFQPTNDKHGVTIIVKSLKSSHRTEVNAFAIIIV